MALILAIVTIVAVILDVLLAMSAVAAWKEGRDIGKLGPQLAGMALATLIIALCMGAFAYAVCSDAVMLQLG